MNIQEINLWLAEHASGVFCWQKGWSTLIGISELSLCGYVKVIEDKKGLTVEQLPALLMTLIPSLDDAKERMLHLAALQKSNKAALTESAYIENWERVIELANELNSQKKASEGLISLVRVFETYKPEACSAAPGEPQSA